MYYKYKPVASMTVYPLLALGLRMACSEFYFVKFRLPADIQP